MTMTAEAASESEGAFSHICAHHLDEVAHLWSIWSGAQVLPHYDSGSLGELELRVQANIAGARMHGDDAWRICAKFLSIADASEIFAAAQLAFRSYDLERIKAVVDAVEQNSALEQGLISALVWLPSDIAHPWQKKFLQSKYMPHKALALEVCRLRGEDPAGYLDRLLQREDCLAAPKVLNAALRCVGEFKRHELQGLVERHLTTQGETGFWTLYTLILLGRSDLAEQLKSFVFAGPCQSQAINIAFRVLKHDTARLWIREMVGADIKKKWIIEAVQALGDPQVIPWLLGLMREPDLARLAGYAFHTITGIDLVENDLTIAQPESLEQQIERELANESGEMPSDEHLPWPDVAKIARAWNGELAKRYMTGRRHFLGLPLTEAALKATVANGLQLQRHAAALELALGNKDMRLTNTFGCIAAER